MRQVSVFVVGPDLPVLSTLDWRAAVLAAAAMLAMLRFKAGMIPTLLGCGAAGLLMYFASL